jgi:hypothetical protein
MHSLTEFPRSGATCILVCVALACAATAQASLPFRSDLAGSQTKEARVVPPVLQAATPLVAANPNPLVLPPASLPYGASYGTWGGRWWQWAVSAPFLADPITDETGARCGINQSGPVWFLAGNFGGETVRSCTVPAGKAIFFPIVNFFAEYPCPPEFGFEPAPGQTLEEFLRGFIAPFIDDATNMAVEVDGVALADLTAYRGATFFDMTLHPSWADIDPCATGDAQPTASDGYWIMLAPLAPGPHTIHFHAELPDFGFVLDVTYNLRVLGGRGRGGVAGEETSSWGLVKSLYK